MIGYPSSGIGGSLSFSRSKSEDVKRSFTPRTSGSVYMSAFVNVSSVGSGNYFLHLNATGTDFRARVGAKNDGNGAVLFGVGTNLGTLTYGTTVFYLNTTYLLVASYNIDSGVSSLYVLNAPVNLEPTSPEATNTGTSGTTISFVSLRKSSKIPNLTIDGLNVSTTWETVLTINEFNQNEFKIFPNPTSVRYVNIASNNTNVISMVVYDVLGKQVISHTMTNSRLNVASLKTGQYIMKISQGQATITKKLVIK